MEKKIEIKPENGIALRVSLPGETQDISFADITKYWDFGDEDSVDHISYMTRRDHVFFLMLTEDRQNGAVAGWDIGKKELFHMSEGSYAISMKLFDGELYTLCRVANPVVPEHFQIYRVPVGTFDPSVSGKRVYCQRPCSSRGFSRNMRLDISRGGVRVTDGKSSVTYADSPRQCPEAPAEGFAHLYRIPMPLPGTEGSEKIEGMFT